MQSKKVENFQTKTIFFACVKSWGSHLDILRSLSSNFHGRIWIELEKHFFQFIGEPWNFSWFTQLSSVVAVFYAEWKFSKRETLRKSSWRTWECLLKFSQLNLDRTYEVAFSLSVNHENFHGSPTNWTFFSSIQSVLWKFEKRVLSTSGSLPESFTATKNFKFSTLKFSPCVKHSN